MTETDSPTEQIESPPEFEDTLPRVLDFLEAKDFESLDQLITTVHASVIVDVLYNLDEDQQEELLQRVTGLDTLSEIMAHCNIQLKTRLLSLIDDIRLAAIVRRLDLDDAADVLSILSRRRQVRVLKRLRPGLIKELSSLLAYDEQTAGSVMNPRFAILSVNETAGSALDRITSDLREGITDTDTDLSNVFVLDSASILLGVLSFRELLSAEPSALVAEVMRDEFVSVFPADDQEDAAWKIADYDLSSLPVISSETGEMLGVITVDDILDVIAQEHAEDISRLAGTGQDDTVGATLGVALRSRMPWLLMCCIGGSLGAAVLGSFSGTLEKAVALAFFMPVVFGMGGNVGSQSSTITVRGIATGELGISRFGKRIRKEATVGLGLGLIFASLLFVISFGMLSELQLSMVVATSVVCTMTCASALGAALPVMFDRIAIDPAIASGPLVSTITDILSIGIYLSVAYMLLS